MPAQLTTTLMVCPHWVEACSSPAETRELSRTWVTGGIRGDDEEGGREGVCEMGVCWALRVWKHGDRRSRGSEMA